MRNLINLILFPVFFSSCAILYTGEDIPQVPMDKIQKVNCSATFRFLNLLDYKNVQPNSVSYRISNVHDSKLYLNYISDLSVFNEVKVIDFPLSAIEIKGEDQLVEFLNKNNPKTVTDYFVDVHMIKPFTYHGTGLGMWGGLFSTITLGVLPAWWTHETDFKVYIYKEGKKFEQLNLKNDYNSFSSTLFYLVPGNETFINSGNRLMIPHKNEINYIIQNITQKICQH